MNKTFYTALLIFTASIAAASGRVDSVENAATKDLLAGNNMNSIMNLSNGKLMSNVIVMYNHLASKSSTKGSLKAAEEMLLKKSIPLSIRYGTDRTNYNCFMALAQCYVDQKKYTQAKWYFIQSNISAKKAKYGRGEVLSLMQLAKLKKVIGDDRLALEDFKEAEKLAIKINFNTQLPLIRKSIATFPKGMISSVEDKAASDAAKEEKGS